MYIKVFAICPHAFVGTVECRSRASPVVAVVGEAKRAASMLTVGERGPRFSQDHRRIRSHDRHVVVLVREGQHLRKG